MRISSSVTSLSWIPSEAVKGMTKLPFSTGIAHWDSPPPEVLDDLEALRLADRFRFANELRAWIDVRDGRITGHGFEGGGHIGVTKMRLGRKEVVFQAVQFPTIRPEPVVEETWVRFTQTCGGRTGAPMPRPVPHPPFVRVAAPSAWTTLALTIHADGSAEHHLAGASAFPRHWIYDHAGKLVQKTGVIDFKTWAKHAFGERTPWGEEDSKALVTEVETALERELSTLIMRGGAKPKRRRVREGRTLVEEGEAGRELFLLLDGVLAVEVAGSVLAEVGPGAVVGERALLEGGVRTSTLRAVTPCTVVVARAEDIDRAALEELSVGHRREERDEG